jgi:thioredoxin-like negative regulator of GroEL|tara:strand:+ start:236 stop:610 length:375 start_codon:yes stop_codon:yes gene_type:complete
MRYLIGLMLFLSTLTAQVTDKNFKDKVGSGFTVIVFTSEWQEKELDDSVLKGVGGFEDAKVLTVKSDDVKKVCKKLRIRNYPSIALFHDGSKVDTWKADMDGEVECDAGDIKKAISEVMAGDQF